MGNSLDAKRRSAVSPADLGGARRRAGRRFAVGLSLRPLVRKLFEFFPQAFDSDVPIEQVLGHVAHAGGKHRLAQPRPEEAPGDEADPRRRSQHDVRALARLFLELRPKIAPHFAQPGQVDGASLFFLLLSLTHPFSFVRTSPFVGRYALLIVLVLFAPVHGLPRAARLRSSVQAMAVQDGCAAGRAR